MEPVLNIFKALSDKNRLRIVRSLMQYEELCACQIIEILGVAGATASRHLAQLQSAGLITSRKEGRWNYFKLSKELPQDFPMEWLQNILQKFPEVAEDDAVLTSILLENPVDICRRQRGE